MQVPDMLSGEKGAELAVNLKFKKLGDFGPDSIAEQVPELKKLLELRQAITALKGPLGNIPAFKKKISNLLADDKAREKLVNELGIAKGEG
jgi:type VI secretion system protein ImpB